MREPAPKATTRDIHPSTEAVLQYFNFSHLPEPLRSVSEPFCDLAGDLADKLTGPELTVALRKLLEAKDAAVRAAVSDGVKD